MLSLGVDALHDLVEFPWWIQLGWKWRFPTTIVVYNNIHLLQRLISNLCKLIKVLFTIKNLLVSKDLYVCNSFNPRIIFFLQDLFFFHKSVHHKTFFGDT
jgi:hypothetical protein